MHVFARKLKKQTEKIFYIWLNQASCRRNVILLAVKCCCSLPLIKLYAVGLQKWLIKGIYLQISNHL